MKILDLAVEFARVNSDSNVTTGIKPGLGSKPDTPGFGI